MTDQCVIQADYVDVKTVRTRSVVQVILEIPIEDGDHFVKLFGMPKPGANVPCALARLKPGSAPKEERQTAPKEKRSFSEMSRSQQAGILCNDPSFHEFLRQQREAFWVLTSEYLPDDKRAAQCVRNICSISSRSALDVSGPLEAKGYWDGLNRDYLRWKAEKDLPPIEAYAEDMR